MQGVRSGLTLDVAENASLRGGTVYAPRARARESGVSAINPLWPKFLHTSRRSRTRVVSRGQPAVKFSLQSHTCSVTKRAALRTKRGGFAQRPTVRKITFPI